MKSKRVAAYILAGLLLIGMVNHFSKQPTQLLVLLILIGGIALVLKFPAISPFKRQYRQTKSKRRRTHLRVIEGYKDDRARSSSAANQEQKPEEPTRYH